MVKHILRFSSQMTQHCFAIITTWCILLTLRPFDPVMATTFSSFRRKIGVVPVRSAINRDTRYGPWLNPTQILYRLDTTYTATETSTIQQAMTQISSDTGGCIKFQPYVTGTNAGTDHIFIGKTLNNGQAIPTCFSFPGRVLTQAGQGQKMAVFGASNTNGCLDTVRDVMKYLVHVLGLRNEYNRPDRDQYIQTFPANIRPELQALNILRPYTAAQVDYLNTAFDFNSVTIPSASKYANPGTLLYTPTISGVSFGTLPRLSQGDCIGIVLQYPGCSIASCQNPYVTQGIPVTTAATTGTTGTGTTAATTTGNTATTTPNTATTTPNTATTTVVPPGGGGGVPIGP
ncbi:hypothetical protein BV898_04421 [Hypsibius exemplaris]|uniref:Peptidase M12A domain-containing protein n=1 Tax=Hypsibius exemplaris TaxID=2072580 RepID=A0A1W0X209_HYPEX|nr:hypothetical protein BV898_04421 [Hypsibius exemplaris]